MFSQFALDVEELMVWYGVKAGVHKVHRVEGLVGGESLREARDGGRAPLVGPSIGIKQHTRTGVVLNLLFEVAE